MTKKRREKKSGSGFLESSRNEASSPYEGDSRFRVAATRPQFKIGAKSRQEESKVVLDERFASLLTDPRFRVADDGDNDHPHASRVDKYGRWKKKAQLTASAQDELGAFYAVEKSTQAMPTSGKEHGNTKETDRILSVQEIAKNADEIDSDSNDDDGKDEHLQRDGDTGAYDPEERIAYLTALSRGEIDGSSSSSEPSSDEDVPSSDESDGDESIDRSVRGKAGVLDPSTRLKMLEDVQTTYERSRFLAVLNLEWNAVRAVDILAILSSFAPPGSVKSVRVYPSDFGTECMTKEEALGPQDIWRDETHESSAQDLETANASEQGTNDDDGNDSDNQGERGAYDHFETGPQASESDFDTEKLRAYEAAKLKYYFAVAEFATEEAADIVYREVDGMEVGHSSACIDMRLIPAADIESAVGGRKLRDESLLLPSNYSPPDFVVSALQQTAVKCTWEEGDLERESKLTMYGAWEGLTERDDLKAYLASDGSGSDDSDNERISFKDRNNRLKMRQLLGLENSDDEEDVEEETPQQDEQTDSEEELEGEENGKEIVLMPAKRQLEEKIRNKVETKDSGVSSELTPWQKYLEKRKEKRREKRRTAREEKKAQKQQEQEYRRSVVGEKSREGTQRDEFFLEDEKIAAGIDSSGELQLQTNSRADVDDDDDDVDDDYDNVDDDYDVDDDDDDDEKAKDYNMRDLLRVEQNKSKKLRGSRKRKEDRITADVPGLDFEINPKDERFAALLDGDDERFGIDRTDPNFRDTPAMRVVLAEQKKRRLSKRKRKRPAETTSRVPRSAPENSSRDRSSLGHLAGRLKSNVKRQLGVKKQV